MMQQRLPKNDAMMRHHSTSETMRMAVRDTERECLGEACRRCVCNQHQDWELHDRRRNQHKRPTSSVRGHEVLQENLLLPITSYQKSFLAPIGPTVSNRAASCATLQRQRSLSSVLTQARLFLSRLVILGLLSLGYTNSNCSCCLHAPPRQLFCGLCRRCLLFEGGQCAHRCHCRPRCFLHLLCWLRRWPVGLSEDFL